ncbi:MAG: ATP-binding protein [Ferruginibacter sp.]
MKSLVLAFGFIVAALCCSAQDTTLIISRNMMDPKYDQLKLTDKNGWIFHPGNDTSQNTNGNWIKLKPADISIKYADEHERVEGWFKINIRLDSSFENVPVGIRMSTWAAFDLYIDGKLISSFGSTGSYGKPYEENMPYNKASIPTGLTPGKDHSIAIHFVDYEIHFPVTKLKSQVLDINSLIRLTGPAYNTAVLKSIRETIIYDTIWITACAVLSILFFLLFIQNPLEKNIRLMAFTCAALGALMFFQSSSQGLINLTYRLYSLFTFFSNLSFSVLLWMVPVTIAGIFQRKITLFTKSILIISCLVALAGNYLGNSMIILAAVFTALLVCAWYLSTSWKKLKGAQWAVVIGSIISFVLGIIFIIVSSIYGREMPGFYFYVTGYCLSIPLSLLVYMSMRFKEIITEVQEKAAQLVQLSSEKEQQALNQQKILEEEVKRQTAEIRSALDHLKSTQSQLIQSEKMASLGELTAGIAHEIQNPLNFVNNFSEVNAELIEELKMKNEKLKIEDEEVKELLNDIKDNSEKISNHGKRADAIVKGMLQHSRTIGSTKEPTDINKLADEYLRLAYHGLRAKDKSFNATLKTVFDETIGNINIIPQDIGRVILNLITNAFYTVAEKKKQNPNNYEPTVTVRTSQTHPLGGRGGVSVTITDNGNGIPQNIIDKIFQPFFTTKPTGQGTGLGLSLAYDIVKAHGGELKVETKENEGTTFIIQLPIV